MVAFAVVLQGHADKYRCQHRKDESLYECNQYFYATNEQGKRNSYRSAQTRTSHARTGLAEDEYQTDQTQYDDVSGRHVCEKTYH